MAAGATGGARKFGAWFELDIREAGDDELSDAVAVLHDVTDIRRHRVEGDHDLATVVRIKCPEGGQDALAGKPAAWPELGIEAGRYLHREARRHHDRALANGDGPVFQAGVDVVAGGELGGTEGQARALAEELNTDRFGHLAKRKPLVPAAKQDAAANFPCLTGYSLVATM